MKHAILLATLSLGSVPVVSPGVLNVAPSGGVAPGSSIYLDGAYLYMDLDRDTFWRSPTDDNPSLVVSSQTAYQYARTNAGVHTFYNNSGTSLLNMAASSNQLDFQYSGAGFGWTAQVTEDQLNLNTNDTWGNQINVTTFANREKDHGHVQPTNPTLRIYSAGDVDVDDTQWGSLAHDGGEFVLDAGTGTVHLNRGTSHPVRTVTGTTDTPTTADRYVRCDPSSNAVEIDLPAVANVPTGFVLVIKNVDHASATSNACTVDPNASETIDGDSATVTLADSESLTIYSTGSAWEIE